MRRSVAIFAVVAAVLAGAGIYPLQVGLDEYKDKSPRLEEFMRLPDARQLKTASLGYELLVADMLWLKAVQHLGVLYLSSEECDWIYKALDTVTTLDPKFVAPYEIGGLILTLNEDKVELANKLLEKGCRHNPEVWQLPFYIGFNYFHFLKKYKVAAAYISMAAEIEGSPKYLPMLASRLYFQADDPAFALEFAIKVYESTENKEIKERLLKRINLLKAEVEARQLQRAVDIYTSRLGGRPDSLDKLVEAGIIRYVPDEPNGGYYYIDEAGRVKSSKVQENLGLHGAR